MAGNNEIQTVGTAVVPPGVSVATGMSGTINVSVSVDGNTYTLAVSIPTSSGQPYSFNLSDSASTKPLADIVFKDSQNFKVDVSMPEIKSGTTIVDAGFTLQDGSV